MSRQLVSKLTKVVQIVTNVVINQSCLTTVITNVLIESSRNEPTPTQRSIPAVRFKRANSLVAKHDPVIALSPFQEIASGDKSVTASVQPEFTLLYVRVRTFQHVRTCISHHNYRNMDHAMLTDGYDEPGSNCYYDNVAPIACRETRRLDTAE